MQFIQARQFTAQITQYKRVKPQGEKTSTEYARNRWSRLSHGQVVAIVHYLEWRVLRDRRDHGHIVDNGIVEALGTYWYDRAAKSQEP